MQNMEKYFGFRVSVLDELDPVRVDFLKGKAERIVAQYDFNPEEYFVYFHQISLDKTKDEHFGLDGGVAARLRKLELTFAVNQKQERTKRIKIFNYLLNDDPADNIKSAGGADSVTYHIGGDYLSEHLGFRNELITFIDKSVRESHRKLKISVVAHPTDEFSYRIFKKTDQHLTQLDYKFRKPVLLRQPRRGATFITSNEAQPHGVTVMGDQFIFNGPTQVSAAGSHAKTTGTTNQQINLDSTDIEEIKRQLERLYVAMDASAKTPEEIEQVDIVAKASTAAAAGDREGVFKHLKKAGSWTFSMAKEIGVAVAAEIIKDTVV